MFAAARELDSDELVQPARNTVAMAMMKLGS
jgi:hypothetical protein